MKNLRKIGLAKLSNSDAKLTNGGNYLGHTLVHSTKPAHQLAHFFEGVWHGLTN